MRQQSRHLYPVWQAGSHAPLCVPCLQTFAHALLTAAAERTPSVPTGACLARQPTHYKPPLAMHLFQQFNCSTPCCIVPGAPCIPPPSTTPCGAARHVAAAGAQARLQGLWLKTRGCHLHHAERRGVRPRWRQAEASMPPLAAVAPAALDRVRGALWVSWRWHLIGARSGMTSGQATGWPKSPSAARCVVRAADRSPLRIAGRLHRRRAVHARPLVSPAAAAPACRLPLGPVPRLRWIARQCHPFPLPSQGTTMCEPCSVTSAAFPSTRRPNKCIQARQRSRVAQQGLPALCQTQTSLRTHAARSFAPEREQHWRAWPWYHHGQTHHRRCHQPWQARPLGQAGEAGAAPTEFPGWLAHALPLAGALPLGVNPSSAVTLLAAALRVRRACTTTRACSQARTRSTRCARAW